MSNVIHKLQLLWAAWQGVESHTVATHAFWPCGHEAVLVLMQLDNLICSGAYTKKSCFFRDHSSVVKDLSTYTLSFVCVCGYSVSILFD